jgi:hypothetical protein
MEIPIIVVFGHAGDYVTIGLVCISFRQAFFHSTIEWI